MSISRQLRTALTVGAFSILAVSPALAQGKGNGNGNGKGNSQQRAAAQAERQRPTLQLRTDRIDDDDRRQDDRYGNRTSDRYDDLYDDRYDDRRDTQRRNVPPGWCSAAFSERRRIW